MSHDDSHDVYEFTAKQFDDVAAFKGVQASNGTRDLHYRMYDAGTGTVAYATRARGSADREVAIAIRDATGTDIAS